MWQNIIKNGISFLENKNCVNLTMQRNFCLIFLFCTINNFCLLSNSTLPNIIDCNTCKSWKSTEIVVMKIYLSLYKAETLQEGRLKSYSTNADTLVLICRILSDQWK